MLIHHFTSEVVALRVWNISNLATCTHLQSQVIGWWWKRGERSTEFQHGPYRKW